MSKHEAVDRLMALATEKRADRTPQTASTEELLEHASTGEPGNVAPASETGHGAGNSGATAGLQKQKLPASARGRQLFETLRPLLPAVAGAMRLVDHGAVQAVARLLPLLGGIPLGGISSPPVPQSSEPSQELWQRTVAELKTVNQAAREEIDTLTLKLASADELLGRTRTQMERITLAQVAAEREIRAMGDRVRLLSAGLIILLMLVIGAGILLVFLLHR